MAVALCAAPFDYHVLSVVSRSTREDMLRIAAWRIVAMMASKYIGCKFSMRDVVCVAVCQVSFAGPNGEHAVILPIACAKPGPASMRTARLVNFRPKTFIGWVWWYSSRLGIAASAFC